MADTIYPQSTELNEYRYLNYPWLNEIAVGLTAGAEKHPGETWHDIPAKSTQHEPCGISRCGLPAIGVTSTSSMQVCAA